MSTYTADEHFLRLDPQGAPLTKGEYENCVFEDCKFNEQHLTGFNFMECAFINCDFTNVRLGGTGLKDVSFDGCKLMGVNFTEADPFLLKVQFSNSVLKYSNFYRMDLNNTRFDQCDMEGTDLTEAKLQHSSFLECELKNARFENTHLEKADLRTARNYIIDPEKNALKSALFSRSNLSGLLNNYPLQIVD